MMNRNRRLWILAAASVASLVGLVWLVLAAGDLTPTWALEAATSPLGVKCLVLMGLGLPAVALVVLALGRIQRRGRIGDLHGDEGGTAAVEIVLLFPIGLMILLIITQSALLFNANVMVHYSAFAAARVATVVVPMEIGEEKQNLVWNPDIASNPPSEKLEMIRRAAVLAILPVAANEPPDDTGATAGGDIVKSETEHAFGVYGEDDEDWFFRIGRQYAYADVATEIEIAKPHHWRDDGNPDSDCPYRHHRRDEWTQWGWNYTPYCPYHPYRMDYWWWEDLPIKVEHRFLLQVPYANALMADADGEIEIRGEKAYFTLIKAVGVLSNEGGRELRPRDG